MTLGFTQTSDGKPNYFIKKIWIGLIIQMNSYEEYYNYNKLYNEKFKKDFDDYDNLKPKLHTIRYDPNKLWKAGNLIHPVINNRTPKRFQFAPVIPCKSVQRIDINIVTVPMVGEYSYRHNQVKVDGEILDSFDIAELAINDGFESAMDFLEYFKDGLHDGSLIHWTDKRY